MYFFFQSSKMQNHNFNNSIINNENRKISLPLLTRRNISCTLGVNNQFGRMKNVLILLLILLSLENVSLKAQEIEHRYKTPSAVRLRNIEKLETNAKFFLVESGVAGVVGVSCLAAGLVKANKTPDYSAHFTKEQKQEYAARWNTSSKVLIGLGAGFTAASAVLGALGVKCIYDIRARKPKHKLKFDLGVGEQMGPSAKLKF